MSPVDIAQSLAILVLSAVALWQHRLMRRLRTMVRATERQTHLHLDLS